MAARLEDLLAAIRALETTSDAIVILGDDVTMKVLSAWTRVDNEWTPPETDPPPVVAGRMARVWAWIRAGWTFDVDEVARLAGVSRTVAWRKLDTLQGARLIYPDGSVAKGAQVALATYVAKKVGAKLDPNRSAARSRAERADRDDKKDDTN
jgi:hypothetical protein